ncbi:MAG: MFS transporter [Desulfobacteraceae bacterium]|nr:MAG: MFS transporter [Desulfobacteraceae bacterium]
MTARSDTAGPLNYQVIFTLTLVHFTGDFYSSFATPLLPVFVEKLGLSLAQVGLLTGTVRLLSFIVQPVTGYFADQYETRFFVLTGLFCAFFFIPLSGIAPNFYILMGCLCLGSIGSSMFHPSTTGMVPLYSGNRTGFCLSIYNTGGTFAFSVGPIFIAWYVAQFGLEKMPWTVTLGAVCFLFCLKYIPMPVSENMRHLGFFGSMKETLGPVWKPITLIWLVMVLRAVSGQTFITFMPIHLTGKGHDLVSVGLIITVFILAGTLSGLAAGYMADRIGFKKIFLLAHLLMTPTLLIYLYLPGSLVYAGAFAAGFTLLATLPLGVVMAQKLAPGSRSMVSSLMMGFAYGLGGALSPLVGILADIYGLDTVLFFSAFIPLACLVLIVRFPDIR